MVSIAECSLCNTPIASEALTEGEKVFCCHGCQAVYTILAKKDEIDGYQEHPLFQQALSAGLISNPSLLKSLEEKQKKYVNREFLKLHFSVEDLWCPSCCQVIKLVLLQEEGIRFCLVDYATDLAVVEYDPCSISKDSLFAIISRLGYSATTLDNSQQQKIEKKLLLRFGIAAFFTLNVMMLAYPLYASDFSSDHSYTSLFSYLSLLMSLPVIFFSGWPILHRCFSALLAGIYAMEALVVTGVSAAFAVSLYQIYKGSHHIYFDSMCTIITLVLLGKIIETRAKFSAKDSLIKLNRALPKRGRKKNNDGSTQFVAIKDLAVGDSVVIAAGEKIVVDGIVIEGQGASDESLMTGEALPIIKKVGSKVLGGTLQSKLLMQ